MPAVPRAAVTAEGAPLAQAGGVHATRGPASGHAHAVGQAAARGAVHALPRSSQVVHLGGRRQVGVGGGRGYISILVNEHVGQYSLLKHTLQCDMSLRHVTLCSTSSVPGGFSLISTL